jgi:hypothetical protein
VSAIQQKPTNLKKVTKSLPKAPQNAPQVEQRPSQEPLKNTLKNTREKGPKNKPVLAREREARLKEESLTNMGSTAV